VTIKFVLCRPRGGLNDMLCQIEHCLRYCRNNGRTLVLDTTKSGMRDDFQKYFSIKDAHGTRVISLAEMPVDIDSLSTIPEVIQGRTQTYEADGIVGGEVRDTQSGEIINFDLRKSYSADLLVQERAGGGINSYWILQHLRPTELVLGAIQEKLAGLPERYISLHIRNTDLQTDYVHFVKSISWALRGRNVMVGTDSGEVQSRLLKMKTGAKEIYFPTQLDRTSTNPLHDAASTEESTILEMLADLFAMALGQRLYFTFTKQGRVSGFSGLAFALSHSVLAREVASLPAQPPSNALRRFRSEGLLSYLKNQAVLILVKAAIALAVRTRESLRK